jgi:L-fuconolactonase
VIVDAHLHVWDPTRVAYPWLRQGPLHRRFDLAEVEPHRNAAKVDAVVLVQAADDPADTALMLESAERHAVVAGVVAWMPLDRPDDLVTAIAERDSRVVGVRTLIHDRVDPDWIITAADVGLGMLAAADIPYDFVTSDPTAMALLPGIAERHPRLRVVVDHLGKPPIGGSERARSRWRALLSDAAANPLTHAKLSGLHRVDGEAATADDIRPFVDDALELFGVERLMMGSDWPICTGVGGFENAWNGVLATLGALDETAAGLVLGGAACNFYRLFERPGA